MIGKEGTLSKMIEYRGDNDKGGCMNKSSYLRVEDFAILKSYKKARQYRAFLFTKDSINPFGIRCEIPVNFWSCF